MGRGGLSVVSWESRSGGTGELGRRSGGEATGLHPGDLGRDSKRLLHTSSLGWEREENTQNKKC